ncbi:hypothetical protein M1O12_04735 [Dehalococcoidia bacterium]|nr:hypothetical protein [Dehalococcoidia bacterium]
MAEVGSVTEGTKMDADREKRIAVLIDADNAQAALIENLLSEISKHG